MNEHLPALLVVVPLLTAPLCLLLPRPLLSRLLALAAVWTTLGLAILLLLRVLEEGTISYMLGGWEAPYGIEYRVDPVNAYVLLVVAGIASIVLAFGPLSLVTDHTKPQRAHFFYSLFLLALAGLLGIAITGDAFNIFVFLEISSLASYAMVALGRHRRALRAAYSYLIVGTLGGTFIMIATGLLYQMTGTLNLMDLAARLGPVLDTRTVLVACVFFFVGISIKLALFPLHQWLPGAYTYAPSLVSAFLAATATKVSYYLLVRVVFTVFGAAFIFGQLQLDRLLIPISLVAMFSGSIAAVYQRDVKRLLAYSSVAQIGYMTLGLACASLTGLTGGLVHLFNHAVMKGGLFLTVAALAYRCGRPVMVNLRGAGRRMPWTMAAFVVGGLALIGVPGTTGFVSKWYLVLAALEKGWTWMAFLIVLSSLLAVAYIWKVVEIAYFKEPPEDAPAAREAPLSMLVPIWILIGATVVFGLWTDLTLGVAGRAAADLLGVSP